MTTSLDDVRVLRARTLGSGLGRERRFGESRPGAADGVKRRPNLQAVSYFLGPKADQLVVPDSVRRELDSAGVNPTLGVWAVEG